MQRFADLPLYFIVLSELCYTIAVEFKLHLLIFVWQVIKNLHLRCKVYYKNAFLRSKIKPIVKIEIIWNPLIVDLWNVNLVKA